MKLPEFCLALEQRLTGNHDAETTLRLAASALRQAFRVTEDEVAILCVDPASETLRFAWPVKLRSAGSIPLSNRNSLAARTLIEGKPQLNNRFAAAFHASVFEQVPLDRTTAAKTDKPRPIQKIMSVPLLLDGAARGVVQICRKGETDQQAGADFSPVELQALQTIAGLLARFI